METGMYSKKIEMTPSMANQYLTDHRYVGQRNVSTPHVRYLANEMAENRFREGTAIALCKTEDNKYHLVNGQHTLSAIVLSRRTQILNIEYHFCIGMDEVASVYATYDRQRTRTSTDIYNAYDLADELRFTKTQTGMFCAGIIFLCQDVSRVVVDRKLSPEEVILFAHELRDRFAIYIDAIEGNSAKGFRRASVVALAIATAKHGMAWHFWNKFATDDGLRRHDPRKIFLEMNRETKLGGNQAGKSAHPMTIFKTGAYCWNKFLKNEPIKRLNMDTVSNVTSLLDTPFSNGFSPEAFNRMLMDDSIGRIHLTHVS